MIEDRNDDLSDSQEDATSSSEESHNKLLVAIIVGIALLIGCVFGAFMLATGISKFSDAVEVIVNEEEDEVVEPLKEEEKVISSKRYIGDDSFGYLEVDSIWQNYENGEEDEMLRYKNGLYIATLYAVPKLQASADTYATSIEEGLKLNEEVSDISRESVEIAGYEAQKLTCYYPNKNIYSSMWFFEADDGKTHYVSIEGPSAENKKFSLPESFVLKKEE